MTHKTLLEFDIWEDGEFGQLQWGIPLLGLFLGNRTAQKNVLAEHVLHGDIVCKWGVKERVEISLK